jgi:DNA-3-methyladenine glycosylase II
VPQQKQVKSNAADKHLRAADPVIAGLIDRDGGPLPHDATVRRRPYGYYGALVRAIAGQQLSVKAAQAIWNRLLVRFDNEIPTPEQILADDPDALREAVGFSRAKTSYLRSLAEHVLDGELELDRLPELSDEVVIAELTAVKGIGEWTAHMFLMFTLNRPDVFPSGDLGVKNAIIKEYDLAPPVQNEQLIEIAEPWRPYRTRASLYLWRSLDNEPIPGAGTGKKS